MIDITIMVQTMQDRLKQILRMLCGETMLGILDYYRFPEWRVQDTAFNDQKIRQKMFMEIVNCFRPKAIVETGTFHGNTTEFMASIIEIPIYTAEYNKRYYAFARRRLRKFSNVEIHCGDSRDYLRKLISSGLLSNEKNFFYLDAHWYEDLPLSEEIEIIINFCPEAIIMVDDFQVPWDQGYGFDDYGADKALTPEYIAPLIMKYNLAQFYPSAPSAQETGCRRGCVVLAREIEIIDRLKKIPCLRAYAVS
jgi:hypothetical protein